MTRPVNPIHHRLFPRVPLHVAVYAAALNAGATLQFAGSFSLESLTISAAAAFMAALAPMGLALWVRTPDYNAVVRAVIATMVLVLCGLFLAYYIFNVVASTDGGNSDTAGHVSVFMFPVLAVVLAMSAFLLVEIPLMLLAAFGWMRRRLDE